MRQIILIVFVSLFSLSQISAARVLDDEKEIIRWKRVAKHQPKNARAWFKLGWYMQKRSFPKYAIGYYKKCIAANRRYVSAYINIANAYKALNKSKEAEVNYKKALKLDKHNALAHYNLGTLYLHQDKLFESINHLKRSVEIDAKNKSAFLNLGTIYLELYRDNPSRSYLNSAKKYLTRARLLDRKYAHVYYNLGRLHELYNMESTAIRYYNEAVRYYPAMSRSKARAQSRVRYLKKFLDN